MQSHECKHETRILRLDREQGETKVALKALVGRVDTLIKVAIGVGIALVTSTLATLAFLVSFWVERAGL